MLQQSPRRQVSPSALNHRLCLAGRGEWQTCALSLFPVSSGCGITDRTLAGYETRFGVTFVDYENNQQRYPKKSALELKNIFGKYIGKLPAVGEANGAAKGENA